MQAVAGVAADGRQIVNRAVQEAVSYKKCVTAHQRQSQLPASLFNTVCDTVLVQATWGTRTTAPAVAALDAWRSVCGDRAWQGAWWRRWPSMTAPITLNLTLL